MKATSAFVYNHYKLPLTFTFYFLLSLITQAQKVDWVVEPTFKFDSITTLNEELLKFKAGNKWGIISPVGSEITPARYDEIRQFSELVARVKLNKKWGFVDIKGKEIVPIEYDSVSAFENGFAKIKLNKKWGFIDENGKEIIEIKYDSVGTFFYNGFSEVNLNKKWGFIDKTGKEITEIKYDNVNAFYNGFAKIKLNKKWGFIDEKGREITEIKYDNAGIFYNGFLEVKLNNKYGFVDEKGREITEIKYDNTGISYNELLEVKLNDRWGFIDKTGKEVIPAKYDSIIFDNKFLRIKLNNRWGFIDKTGKEIISAKYDKLTRFSEGLAGFKLNKKWGFIDENGKEIIPAKYDEVDELIEGLAWVRIKEKQWFIDNRGKRVIRRLSYDYIDGFDQGFCEIKLNGKIGLIDKTGKVIIPPKYDGVYYDFEESRLIEVEINKKQGLLDNTGREIIPAKYDIINIYDNNWIKLKINGKFGVIDSLGREILPIKYGSIESIREELRKIQVGGKYGFIDKTGKEMIPIQFEDAFSFYGGTAWVKLNGKWGIINNPLLKKTEKDFQPFTQIIWKTEDGTVTQGQLKLKAALVSSVPIRKETIQLYQNGQLLTGQKMGETSLSAKSPYQFSQTVQLSEGVNRFELGIMHPNQGEVRSEPLTINYFPPTKPDLYVVSIGINGMGLDFPSADAQQVVEIFQNQKGKLFRQVQAEVYNQPHNTNADNLRNAVGILSNLGITSNDVLVVFVSAHGKKLNTRSGKTDFAILTSNYNSANVFTEENTALLYESHLMEYLKPISAKKLLFFDACHSGQTTLPEGGKARYLQDLLEAQEVVKRTPAGITTIASSGDGQLSYEDVAWQHGAFTKALVEGLKGAADTDKDGYVFVSELFGYIAKTVPPMVKQIKKQEQVPQMYPPKMSNEQDFPIVKY